MGLFTYILLGAVMLGCEGYSFLDFAHLYHQYQQQIPSPSALSQVAWARHHPQPTTNRRPISLLNSIRQSMSHLSNRAQTVRETTTQLPGYTNVCDVICPRWCASRSSPDVNVTDCHFVCGNVCNKQTIARNPYVGNSRFEVVPSEFQFTRYDVNDDKRVSLEEFAREEGVSRQDAQVIFDFADFNGDGYLDTDEMKGGPFVFTVQMAAEFSNMAKAFPATV
ncbi:hypothetical protein MAR_010906 [Mya arenaria]|uniref:EF-hand domain-containing protein n=1 Tax=Mya arenaria TaxID=6604 RepID=A0ABY7FU97_MYAAR|nr:uncharacterized protein LOC128215832 [Mya arenaria]WAR25202.1 hypothetical protein MAR_010906 [Mya arenaria]